MDKKNQHPDFDSFDRLISNTLQNEKQPELPKGFSDLVLHKIEAKEAAATFKYQPVIPAKIWWLISALLVFIAALAAWPEASPTSPSYLDAIKDFFQPVQSISFEWLMAFRQPALALSVMVACSLLVLYFYLLTRKSFFRLEL